MARASGGQVRKKKGEAGAAKNYITRTQAIKKLQCSMSDFRRLCILKGIYPRQPRNHKKANKGSTAPASFYYVKDIQYLLHEPVLHKLREHKAFAKKLSRAIGRGEWSNAKSLEENKKPKYRLDHIVKERYPSFPDALRDMDDALSLIILFAHLPATEKIPAEIVANCSKLAAEWQLYVMRTRALRKIFLSVKGIYFQADVKGEIITWLVPYMFTQNIPSDIDFRVMMTFLELYQTTLGFVLFRLYHEINLNYPPKLDKERDDEGAGIGALLLEETSRTLTIEGKKGTEEGLDKEGKKISAKDVKKQIRQITHHSNGANGEASASTAEEESNGMTVDSSTSTSANADIPKSLDAAEAEQPTQQTDEELTSLFSNYFFYLSREVTRPTLEFVIRSFGGQVGWDAVLGAGSPYNVDDPRITHHVIDRPVPSTSAGSSTASSSTALIPGVSGGKRAYIQPQWVVDCINLRKVLPTGQYAPGQTLPPHLSPFVDYDQVRRQGGYIPTEAGGEAVEISEGEEDDEEEDVEVEEDDIVTEDGDEEEEFTGFGNGDDVEDEVDDSDEAAAEEDVSKSQPRPALLAAASNPDDASLVHEAELEAEAHGIPYSTFETELTALKKTLASTSANGSKKGKAAAAAADPHQPHSAQTQEANPASILLSNKQRKLFNKMKFGENKRNLEAEKLREKKKLVTKQEKKQKKKV